MKQRIHGQNKDITRYFDEKMVFFLHAHDRNEALAELIDLAWQQKKIPEKEPFLKAILEREKIVSTGIGMGVAIPHAKMTSLNEFFIAIGIQKGSGLDWDAIDQSPVRIIFMIGGPDNRQTEYLNILSLLTLVIRNEQLRKRLLLLPTSKDVANLLRDA